MFTELNVLNPEFDVPLGSKQEKIQSHKIMNIFLLLIVKMISVQHSSNNGKQPRPQGLLLDDFQNGGSSGEDPGQC